MDKALADQVSMLRNMLQLESGTRDAPPGIRNIRSGSVRINLLPDGTPEIISKPFTVTKQPDGTPNVQIIARSEEELERIIPHIAAALRVDEAALRQQLANTPGKVVRGRVDPIHFQLILGGPDVIRSIVKSCLVLLATKVGTRILRTDSFADAREFVLNGDHNFNIGRTSLDPRELPDAALLEERHGPLYNLVYIRSDAAGRTIGHFTLYNLIAWQVVLAEANGPPNLGIGIVSNPITPGEWSDKIADNISVDFAWLNTPDKTDLFARGQKKLAAAMQRYMEIARKREIGRVIDRVLGRYYQPGEEIIADERRRLAFAEIADQLARFALNLPYEEPFMFSQPSADKASGDS